MELDFACLAEEATEGENGRLTLTGVGMNYVPVPGVPCKLAPFWVVAQISFPRHETNKDYRLEVAIFNTKGMGPPPHQSVIHVGAFTEQAGRTGMPFSKPIMIQKDGFTIPSGGIYTVELKLNGRSLKKLRFYVDVIGPTTPSA